MSFFPTSPPPSTSALETLLSPTVWPLLLTERDLYSVNCSAYCKYTGDFLQVLFVLILSPFS